MNKVGSKPLHSHMFSEMLVVRTDIYHKYQRRGAGGVDGNLSSDISYFSEVRGTRRVYSIEKKVIMC